MTNAIMITNANSTTKQAFKGIMLEIARSNTPEYISKLRFLTKPFQRQIDAGDFPVEKDIEITAKALAGTVLVGWQPFTMPNGDQIEYSLANAENLLINDNDCRKFVLEISREWELYERQAEEDAEGK